MDKAKHNFAGRGKPKTEAPPIPEDTKTTFTHGQAASFLADRLATNASDRESIRNKVFGLIDYALKHEQLDGSAEAIPYGKLIAWARGKTGYAAAVEELSGDVAEFVDDSTSFGADEIFEAVLPSGLSRCHHLLSEQTTEIARLRAENAALAAALANARLELNKVEKRREAGRSSATKGNISRKPV